MLIGTSLLAFHTVMARTAVRINGRTRVTKIAICPKLVRFICTSDPILPKGNV